MDTDRGRFVEEEEAAAHMERLAVGETVKIKGAEFAVVSIGEREVVLKLLSSEDRVRRVFSDMVPGEGLEERMQALQDRESPFSGGNRHERRRRERENRRR